MKPVSQKARDMAMGMSFAKQAALGKQIRDLRSPLLVRSDWVMEQIKQRDNYVGVKELVAENKAQWEAINPVWAKYGPELVLTSRGTPGHLEGVQEVALSVGFVGSIAMLYGLWKMWRGPKEKKKKYEQIAAVGAVAWLGARAAI